MYCTNSESRKAIKYFHSHIEEVAGACSKLPLFIVYTLYKIQFECNIKRISRVYFITEIFVH